MTTTEIFLSVVMALSSCFYTLATFQLLRATKNTGRLVHDQLDAIKFANKSSAHHSVIDGHRNLFLELIKDE